MTSDQVHKAFNEILEYYDSIPSPKFRHADLDTLKEKFEQLQCLKGDLGHDKEYHKLISGMSQIIAKLNRYNKLASMPKDRIWSNYSERGMNKVIPPILNCKGQTRPVEWTDRWENTCRISKGHWGAKNYRVMDALGYMFLMKMERPVNSSSWPNLFIANNATDVISLTAFRAMYSLSSFDTYRYILLTLI